VKKNGAAAHAQLQGDQIWRSFASWAILYFGQLFEKVQESILRLLNLQLHRQRCSRLERFYVRRKIFIIKTRHAIR
jgi:hypothetical protein